MVSRFSMSAFVALSLFFQIANANEFVIEKAVRLVVPPGNIAISPDGRIFVSLHQFFEPRSRVIEILEDGAIAAYPDPIKAASATVMIDAVLGLAVSPDGILWLLDNGLRGEVTPKLVGWNLEEDALHRVIELPEPTTVRGSFVNDLAVDSKNQAIYIADPAEPSSSALIVVDLNTGESRRVLQGHSSVVPGEGVDLVVNDEKIFIRPEGGDPVQPKIGVNPIALDADSEWLYYGPMNGLSMYRIPTEALRDAELSGEQLAEKVERYSDKPVSDGSLMDAAGNLYVTDVGANAIGVIGTDREYRVLASDPAYQWPDAFAMHPDGWIYVVMAQLPASPVFNEGSNAAKLPFEIYRFRMQETASE